MARAEVDPTSIARDVGSFWITGVAALDVPPNSDPVDKLGRLAPQPPRLTVAKTMTHSLAVFMRIVPPSPLSNGSERAVRQRSRRVSHFPAGSRNKQKLE